MNGTKEQPVLIGGGIYVFRDRVECDIPKMLAAYGMEDTEANRDLMVEESEKALKASGLVTPHAKVSHTHLHNCAGCGRRFEHVGKRKKCRVPKRSLCPRCSS